VNFLFILPWVFLLLLLLPSARKKILIGPGCLIPVLELTKKKLSLLKIGFLTG